MEDEENEKNNHFTHGDMLARHGCFRGLRLK